MRIKVGKPSLWCVTNSSGWQGTVSLGEGPQIGAGTLKLYLTWKDENTDTLTGYVINYMISGAGIGASPIPYPINARISHESLPGVVGSQVYLSVLTSNKYLTFDEICGNFAMLTFSADMGPGYSVNILFFGLRAPTLVASIPVVGLPTLLASFKGIAGISGMDLGMPMSIGSMLWSGIYTGTEGFNPN